MTTIQNVNELASMAAKSGFDVYGSFNEGDEQHEILTCTKGKYSGEVIDIYWDYHSGDVHRVEYSCQFSDQVAKFRFNSVSR